MHSTTTCTYTVSTTFESRGSSLWVLDCQKYYCYAPVTAGHYDQKSSTHLTCMIRKIDSSTGGPAVPNLAQTRPVEAVAPSRARLLLLATRSHGHKVVWPAPHQVL